MLLDVSDWKRVTARSCPPREGQPVVGLDLGSFPESWTGLRCSVGVGPGRGVRRHGRVAVSVPIANERTARLGAPMRRYTGRAR